jgi:hypothetical protein
MSATFYFMCGIGVSSRDFESARQMLCHLSDTSSLFNPGYFGDKVLLFAQAGLDLDFPI